MEDAWVNDTRESLSRGRPTDTYESLEDRPAVIPDDDLHEPSLARRLSGESRSPSLIRRTSADHVRRKPVRRLARSSSSSRSSPISRPDPDPSSSSISSVNIIPSLSLSRQAKVSSQEILRHGRHPHNPRRDLDPLNDHLALSPEPGRDAAEGADRARHADRDGHHRGHGSDCSPSPGPMVAWMVVVLGRVLLVVGMLLM